MSDEDVTADPDADSGADEDWESVPSPQAEAETDADDSAGAADAADRLVARIAEHDEALAEDVRRLIERGAELREVATDLESTLDERDRDVADLQERVEEREQRIEDLESDLEEREERIEELEESLRRTQADFKNYKKRAEKKRERVEERATEDLVERLLDVRDNLRRALEEEDPDVDSLLDGVEMTLREFDRVLDDEDVSEIEPDLGDEIDPTRHEVMMRTESEQPADTVADVYAPGYEMAGQVVRPARVTVSTGPPDETDGESTDGADAARPGSEE